MEMHLLQTDITHNNTVAVVIEIIGFVEVKPKIYLKGTLSSGHLGLLEYFLLYCLEQWNQHKNGQNLP